MNSGEWNPPETREEWLSAVDIDDDPCDVSDSDSDIDDSMAEDNEPQTPTFLKSVKLDILAKIADYHLEDDGREPLVHGTDRRSVVVPEDIRMSSPPPTDATSAVIRTQSPPLSTEHPPLIGGSQANEQANDQPARRADGTLREASEIQFCNSPTDEDGPVNLGGASPSKPDKIVVFSYFPSSNFAIQAVLALYGIKTLVLHGGHQPPQRAAILREFRESGREGPRVLILSSAGAVGLNIDCANLMIIVDTLWSGLEDEQLRGRIWRYPQSKHVVFYRLVALDTPDVFLNTISFNKARIHDAFTNADPAIKKMFLTGPDDEDINGAEITDEVTDGGDADAVGDKRKRAATITATSSRAQHSASASKSNKTQTRAKKSNKPQAMSAGKLAGAGKASPRVKRRRQGTFSQSTTASSSAANTTSSSAAATGESQSNTPAESEGDDNRGENVGPDPEAPAIPSPAPPAIATPIPPSEDIPATTDQPASQPIEPAPQADVDRQDTEQSPEMPQRFEFDKMEGLPDKQQSSTSPSTAFEPTGQEQPSTPPETQLDHIESPFGEDYPMTPPRPAVDANKSSADDEEATPRYLNRRREIKAGKVRASNDDSVRDADDAQLSPSFRMNSVARSLSDSLTSNPFPAFDSSLASAGESGSDNGDSAQPSTAESSSRDASSSRSGPKAGLSRAGPPQAGPYNLVPSATRGLRDGRNVPLRFGRGRHAGEPKSKTVLSNTRALSQEQLRMQPSRYSKK